MQDGRTALHWAAYNGDPSAIAKLLDRGAQIEAKDKNVRTRSSQRLRPSHPPLPPQPQPNQPSAHPMECSGTLR